VGDGTASVVCAWLRRSYATQKPRNTAERAGVKGRDQLALWRLFWAANPQNPKWVCALLSCQYNNYGLLSWRYGNLAFRRSWQCPGGTDGAPTYRICIRTQKKAERTSQWHHQTPLLTEKRFQDANRSWTKRQLQAVVFFFIGRFVQTPGCELLFALTMRFRIVFVRRPSSSCGLSYIPTKTNNAEQGTSRAHMWANFRAWEMGPRPYAGRIRPPFRLQSCLYWPGGGCGLARPNK
jgi:hypothetical protein